MKTLRATMNFGGKIGARLILTLVAVGVVVADLLAPWWLTGGLAYVATVLFSLWIPQRPVVLLAAVAGTGLTILAHLSPANPGLTSWLILAHCVLWVAAIWVTAIVILQRRSAEEERARLFNLSLDLLCIAGLDGYLKSVNPAFETLLGFSTRELLERPYLDFIHPDDKPKVTTELEKLARGIPTVQFEVRGRHKDGSYRWLAWNVFPLPQEGLLYAVGRDVTDKKQAEQALRQSENVIGRSQKELRALTAKLMSAQEEERRRLARELHDDLNQRLAMLGIEASKLQEQLPAAPDLVQERLRWLEEQLGKLSDDVRLMSHQMHPAVLDYLGLGAALDAECDAFSKREGVAVNFKQENLPESLPEAVALCLYRVAQESLRNVAKHAHASQVTVKLAGSKDAVTLSIFDSGVGFDPEAVEGHAGLGLASMEERVRLVEGTFSITSWPGEGTEVAVRVPLRGGVDETATRAGG